MTRPERVWMRSFFTRAIAFRFLLTPLGTIVRTYNVGDYLVSYTDVYIFGIRIARIHRP